MGQCSEPLSRWQPVDARGHNLGTLVFETCKPRRWHSSTARKLEGELERVAKGMAGLLDNLQEMARGIHPAIVAPGGGLESALKALARRCTVPVELDVRGVARLPGRRRSPPATWSRKR